VRWVGQLRVSVAEGIKGWGGGADCACERACRGACHQYPSHQHPSHQRTSRQYQSHHYLSHRYPLVTTRTPARVHLTRRRRRRRQRRLIGGKPPPPAPSRAPAAPGAKACCRSRLGGAARADAVSVARSARRQAVIEAGDGRREPPVAARVYVWGVAWRGRLESAADAGRARGPPPQVVKVPHTHSPTQPFNPPSRL
jgi:hypothetical protein